MNRSVNIPNALTISRIILGVIVIYLFLQHDIMLRIIAGLLFIVAAITDLLDGKLARKYNIVTKFGKIADPIADKVLNLGAFITFTVLGMFSFWWLVPVIARELLVTIYRFIFIRSKKDLAARKSGKVKTIIQYVTIGAIFFNLIFRDHINLPIIDMPLKILMYACLIVTVIVTIYSGLRATVWNKK